MKTKGITSDSRLVKPGYTYIAIKGTKFNGEDFINEAIKNGATRIVVSEDSNIQPLDHIEVIKVPNTRKALALFAAEFYNNQPENIVAVTGTNGKTSTANFYKQIASFAGYKSASIGTLGVLCDDLEFDNSDALTSPDSIKLHEILSTLQNHSITHVGIEASSHGLSQFRLDGVKFKAAAFTNFTQDHLDYHDTMEEYFMAKVRLFSEVVKGGYAVLNADIPEFPALHDICLKHKLNIIDYGKNANNIQLIECGEKLRLSINNAPFESDYHLNGDFQVYNVMAALGLAMSVGISLDKCIQAIPHLKAAPGRLELAGMKNNAKIFIDYAHTPDALENAIKSLRSSCKNNLHVLFGCGGDRDPKKRSIMGQIANDLADKVIVTDDNPRTENPEQIRKQILSSCPKAQEIENRATAIKSALDSLQNHDVLLIAGKGHEDYQIIGTVKHHFSDIEEVQKYLNK
jgi:UDP-N-acetylmuramoyl-L-alanyl-D-glutamate--2,6-diaminopimelate ligase